MADEVHAAAVAAGRQATSSEISLKRALTLPHAVLYGMGVTVGAGIYVLIGGRARRHARATRLRHRGDPHGPRELGFRIEPEPGDVTVRHVVLAIQ